MGRQNLKNNPKNRTKEKGEKTNKRDQAKRRKNRNLNRIEQNKSQNRKNIVTVVNKTEFLHQSVLEDKQNKRRRQNKTEQAGMLDFLWVIST